MAHCNTIFSQILKLVSRHEFESLAKQHHSGRAFRTASRWSQFIAMMMAQMADRNSLRDIVENLSAQTRRLYHLGSTKLTRSTLSRINEDKPYTLYEALFGKLLSRCQGVTPAHTFRFKNPLYSLDASTIDLCLSAFPWADFRSTKGAIKLHVGLNHGGYLPEFVTVTEGKTSDIEIGRTLNFPKGSIVAVDRGYNDYEWYSQLTDKGIFFVTRSHRSHRSSSGGSSYRTPSSPSKPSYTPTPKPKSNKSISADPLGQQARPKSSYPSTGSTPPKQLKDKKARKNIIMRMQLALQFEGYYNGVIDGIMGPETRKAVTKYKKAKGLSGSSVMDAETLNSLGIKGF